MEQFPQGQEQDSQSATSEPVEEMVAANQEGSKRKLFGLAVFLILLVIIGGGIFLIQLVRKSGQTAKPQPQVGQLPTVKQTDLNATRRVIDNFDLPTLNLDRWDLFTFGSGQIEQREGKVHIETAPEGTESGGILTLKGAISGDFEAVVTIEVPRGSTNSETGLVFHNDSEVWLNRLIISINQEPEGTLYIRAVSVLEDVVNELGGKSIPASPLTVSIKRISNRVMFLLGGEIFAEATGVYTADGTISFLVSSTGPDFAPVSSTFDNFVLNIY